MGEQQIELNAEDPALLRKVTQAVIEDLDTLEELLSSGAIESGVRRIGAEQEAFLVDEAWQPAPAIDVLLEDLDDDHFTCEIGRFNLEINVDPLDLTGSCFERLERRLRELLDRAASAAERRGLHIVLTGILPTLRVDHLTLDNMTPRARYEALNAAMKRLRGEQFGIHIRGLDELNLEHTNVMLEACNTSFQVHYQVAAEEFVSAYNVAQAIAGPVLAAGANSPVLFGRRLWAETRIPLFQQSVDTRTEIPPARRRVPRVCFGRRWVEESVLEIYREDVGRFPVMLAVETSSDEAIEGQPPSLGALSAHNGTVYRWNRPCYGVTAGRPHLRIENRYLPSGPTIIDEVANAAFWCGLMAGLSVEHPNLHREMPFDQARGNFVRGARDGLGAQFDWMDRINEPAERLIRSYLLPLAREGLQELEVDQGDIDLYLAVIDYRTATHKTGARWTLGSLGTGAQGQAESEALTATMYKHQSSGLPVAKWPLAALWAERPADGDLRVRDLMTRNPVVVHEDQVIDLAGSLMDWRRVRHIPVEDPSHRFVGLVTFRSFLRALRDCEDSSELALPVSRAMVSDVVTVTPDTELTEALELMEDREIGCLPVVEGEQLVGMLRERDFLRVAKQALASPTEESLAEAGALGGVPG